jgi:hypothetical protein
MKVAKRPRMGSEAWVVDWYDFGKRRLRTFGIKRDDDDFVSEERRKNRQLQEFAPVSSTDAAPATSSCAPSNGTRAP